MFSHSSFRFKAYIGEGMQGRVFHVTAKNDPTKEYALKVFYKNKIGETVTLEQIDREIQVHKELSHPNIVTMHGSYSFKDQIVMVLDYVDGGDLMTLLVENGAPLEKSLVCNMTRQVCAALQYCHSLGVVHRDIKLENVLASSAKTIFKLADFGHCTHVDTSLTKRHWALCGTSDYLSPDMISRHETGGYDYRVDIWSIGVMLFELLSGTMPFYTGDAETAKTRIKAIDINWTDGEKIVLRSAEIAQGDARDLISKILTYRDQRLSIAEILQHPFISSNSLSGSLSDSPSDSLSGSPSDSLSDSPSKE